MSTLVIGHQNPDTDAICSAIAYADFLRQTRMPDAEAVRCGELNRGTAFVLGQAGVPLPRLVTDVRPTVGSVTRREVVSGGINESLYEVFRRMRDGGLHSMPVVNGDGTVAGMLSVLKLLEMIIPVQEDARDARLVQSSLSLICKVLGGEMVHAVDPEKESELTLTVGAFSAGSFTAKLHQYRPEQVILVTGDRPSIQKPVIEYGVRCLVISGGHRLSPELLQQAQEKKVSVIYSPHETATTSLLIRCSKRVTHAIESDFLAFQTGDRIAEVRERLQATSQTLFPVLDEGGRLAGVFSKSDLVNPAPTQLILVDHNELTQAVTGAEEAEILEVLDHHRLGGSLHTREPIRFLIEPLGCTCTLIARAYREQRLSPEPGIALCMAAGIISDTLYLSSPTTTATDRQMLDWLEPFAGRNLAGFAREFLDSCSTLQGGTAQQAIQTDRKEFEENGWKLSISQIEEPSLDTFWPRKAELAAALKETRMERKADFACLLVTDINAMDSLLLTEGSKTVDELIDYPKLEPNLYKLEGVVSRKKQLLPHLGQLLARAVKSGK